MPFDLVDLEAAPPLLAALELAPPAPELFAEPLFAEPLLVEPLLVELLFAVPPLFAESLFAAPEAVLLPPLFAVFEVVPPLLLAALPALLPEAALAPLLAFDDEEEDVLALLADFPSSFDFDEPDFAAAEPPPDLDFAPEVFPPSLSTKPPTASAATFIAVSAAPVAAPIKISPATSLAVSRTPDEVDFFELDADFFGALAVDFDFVEDAALDVDF